VEKMTDSDGGHGVRRHPKVTPEARRAFMEKLKKHGGVTRLPDGTLEWWPLSGDEQPTVDHPSADAVESPR
jgi:hypothetical protein